MSADANRATLSPDSSNLALLLISLLFALLVAPALEPRFGGRVLIHAGTTAVLVFGVFASRTCPRVFFPSLALALLAVPATWATLVVSFPMLFVASCVVGAVFYTIIAVNLIATIFRKYMATVHSVFGSVCAYLLLGMAFAEMYWATERIDRESLSFPGREAVEEQPQGEPGKPIAPFSEAVYFSFVTMSTLGYGDVVPQSPLARTIAWMQSVLGQFYLAVLVAWLVSAIRPYGPPPGGSGTGRSPSSSPMSCGGTPNSTQRALPVWRILLSRSGITDSVAARFSLAWATSSSVTCPLRKRTSAISSERLWSSTFSFATSSRS
ncbi:MAG TPA: hypothetical protein EYH34_10335 [Planctomycetes bacterium]|nr:hypothetical protein [Planctomycetota bacterium]